MKKKLYYNILSSLVYNALNVISGFILPRIILGRFGSEVNGLVDSISQFLGVIAFLEMGIGAVVRSALYKPLSENDNLQISRILKSANRFFRKLALLLLAYVFVLILIYPNLSNSSFDSIYTRSMVFILSIGNFFQYYFGIVNSLLLSADQKDYIGFALRIVTIILNVFFTIILVNTGASIHAVKFVSMIVFLLQPIGMSYYVSKHYQIDYDVELDGEPISQKWNGVAQHIAAMVLNGTDNIVLTVFSTLTYVSIYSVYNKVVFGMSQLISALTSGVQAMLGRLWAIRERNELKKTFEWVEWSFHTIITFLYAVTMVLIVPFISVYTKGINDANYIQPLFGFLIVAANACICYRLPYNMMILAAGHYRQTQNIFVVSALINVITSILCVKNWGLIGVSIGTLCATTIQTLWMAYYSAKNLIDLPLKNTIRMFLLDIFVFAATKVLCGFINLSCTDYLSWLIVAIKCSCITFLIQFLFNLIFYKKKVLELIRRLADRFSLSTKH